MIKFSVVIPIYNVEKYIGTLIESLQKQTLKDFEMILVDDGSPDKSGEICDSYAKQDTRIHVVHKKNEGVSAARNDGLLLARGKYVIFCDSDDWLPENALEAFFYEGEKNGADVIIGDVYKNENGKDEVINLFAHNFVTEDTVFIDKIIQTDFYRTYCPLPHSNGLGHFYGGPWNKAVRLDFLKKNNIKFDVRVKGIYDDILYTAYILAYAQKVSYITTPVYYYRVIPASITHTFKKNALEINDAIFNSWTEFITAHDRHNMFGKSFYTVVIRRFCEILPVYFFSSKNPNGFMARMNEMKKVMQSSPYSEAIGNVDSEKLSRYQASVLKFMRKNNPFGIFLLFKVKNLLKKMLGKGM